MGLPQEFSVILIRPSGKHSAMIHIPFIFKFYKGTEAGKNHGRAE
jgi:hypothetical protein